MSATIRHRNTQDYLYLYDTSLSSLPSHTKIYVYRTPVHKAIQNIMSQNLTAMNKKNVSFTNLANETYNTPTNFGLLLRVYQRANKKMAWNVALLNERKKFVLTIWLC